ncbi:putative restriction endonuclease domain-containing protein [Gammaproteobacteria bacterium]
MNWQAICDDPQLRDLPFQCETDRWGHIVMSPATNRHSAYQGLIVKWLSLWREDGIAIPECSIQTTEGVKVADVAWVSSDFLKRHGFANPYPEAPEIVVEILSPSNSLAEMTEKKALYLAQGAREFWLCDENGAMRFFDNRDELTRSVLASTFPGRITLPF